MGKKIKRFINTKAFANSLTTHVVVVSSLQSLKIGNFDYKVLA